METLHITNSEQDNSLTPLDKILVSYGETVKPPLKKMPLSWVINEIRTSSILKEKIETVRAISNQSVRQDKKKNTLPWFSFQLFKSGRRTIESFEQTSYIMIDADHVGKAIGEIRKRIEADPDIFLVFVSPSGDGLKIGFKLADSIYDEHLFRRAVQYFRQLLREKFGLETDGDDDPSRACFLSYDPTLFVNPDCFSHKIPDSLSQKDERKRSSRIPEALNGSESPGRTSALSVLIGQLNERGVSQDIALALLQSWNKENNRPPLEEDKVEKTVEDMYRRYQEQSSMRPASIIVQDNCYFLVKGRSRETSKRMLSNFIIIPKELLILEGSDCLSCTVKTNQNVTYEDILIENTDWHSKTKLLKAVGHQDCSFFGSDADIQSLCSFINEHVPIRREGTRIIGLHRNAWVVEGMNITSSGISHEPTIVPFDKGSGAFHHKIAYVNLPESEYSIMIQELATLIPKINEPHTILPFFGWIFATPMKEIIRSKTGSFPGVFIHGGQGSGKSSTVKVLMRLVGYKNAVPNKCDMKPFPMLRNLSATNGIPQFYDEFKVADMKQDQVDSLMRYMREIYDGEMEQKGREDQTTVDYELLAPMVVSGEWNISQPAIRERILLIRFTDVVKKDKAKQEAFDKIKVLPLEGFMPRYIQYCLGQDIPMLLDQALREAEANFNSKMVAPRILNNLAVMIVGLELFSRFTMSLGVDFDTLDLNLLLKNQLKEITGTDSGMVRSAVDQLVEELGIMWQKNEKQIVQNLPGYEPSVKQNPWWKIAIVKDRRVVAIQFNRVFPEFKEYARRTQYEGDLLDKESYLKLFKECEYIIDSSHVVDFEGKKSRTVCIDIAKAINTGIDLEGFGILKDV